MNLYLLHNDPSQLSFYDKLFHLMDKSGFIIFYDENGQIHRDDDLPARIRPNHYKEWWFHGKLHRGNDLPARIWEDGSQEWYVNGKRHRDNDLPARIWEDGYQEWHVNGIFTTCMVG